MNTVKLGRGIINVHDPRMIYIYRKAGCTRVIRPLVTPRLNITHECQSAHLLL